MLTFVSTGLKSDEWYGRGNKIHLKNFGFGKSSMETQIMDEIHEFTTDLNLK